MTEREFDIALDKAVNENLKNLNLPDSFIQTLKVEIVEAGIKKMALESEKGAVNLLLMTWIVGVLSCLKAFDDEFKKTSELILKMQAQDKRTSDDWDGLADKLKKTDLMVH